MRIITLILFPILLQACATTNKGKIIQSTAIGMAVGFTLGQSKSENQTAYSLSYAGIIGLGTAITGLYLFDEEKRSEELRVENISLKNQLDEFENQINTPPKSVVNSVFTDTAIPESIKNLIRPGQIRMYKINKWTQEGANRLVLKTDVIEFIEPKLIPNKNQGDLDNE